MNVPSLGSSSPPRRLEEVFTSSGSSAVPAWANKLTYYVVSGGGGGGKAVAQSAPGVFARAGVGGASGVMLRNTIPISAFRGASVTLTVGAAGAGEAGSAATRGGNSTLSIAGGPSVAAGGGNGGGDIYGGINDLFYDGAFTLATLHGDGNRTAFCLDGAMYFSAATMSGIAHGSGIGMGGPSSGNSGAALTTGNTSSTSSVTPRSNSALNIRIGATAYLLSGLPPNGSAAMAAGNSPNVGAGTGYGYGGTGSSACGPGFTVGNGGQGGPGIIIMIWEE
jgi:hypothetical protein